jgi:hypothetical protein
MKFYRIRSSVIIRLTLSLAILCLILGRGSRMSAHNPGFTQSAPTLAAPSITIDGTIDTGGAETEWGTASQLDLLPNNCADIIADTGAPFNLYSLNDGANLYLAFDITDTTPNSQDALFLFLDPNHDGGATLGVGDRALHLTFSNTAANNTVPDFEHYQVAVAGAWPTPVSGLPAGADAKYSRLPAPDNKWLVEIKIPLAFFPTAAGGTMGAAFIYLNKASVEDCDLDQNPDDFYAMSPPVLPAPNQFLPLVNQVTNPSLWGDLNLGQPIPTVAFKSPICCYSPDIIFDPATQPFSAGETITINARVHNLHLTATAQHVNVEIKAHGFGTGGNPIPTTPPLTEVGSIPPSPGSNLSNSVTWVAEPGHGCIIAEIKAPTAGNPLYTIAGGLHAAQHNIDVECIPQGLRKEFRFLAYNPDEARELPIRLAVQKLLPPELEGLKFELRQPDRPLRPKEEWTAQLLVDVPSNLPITDVPRSQSRVPATAGGTAVPPLRERSGTDPVLVKVNGGDRIHLTASGEVDLDGRGPIPETGPGGRDVTKELGDNRRFLLANKSAAKFGGALIGSFNNFKTSFVIGTDMTLTAPPEVQGLWLAVNDIDGGYGDNTGDGFDVEIATLPPLLPAVILKTAAPASQVTLPQLNIAAVSSARVTAGRNLSYNLLTNYGGVTYQFLVVDGEHHGIGGLFNIPWWIIFLLLLLLLLAVLFFVWIYRRKHRLQAE